jgi:hypothetical protein
MHGDKTRLNQIPALIAADFRKEWGETKHALVYAGHIHHHRAQEFPGIEVEYMRVLCAKDAWHHGQGYRSRRSLRCDVWHHDFGRVTTHEIGMEQLEMVYGAGTTLLLPDTKTNARNHTATAPRRGSRLA